MEKQNDPLGLNVDLKAVDTSYPVAAPGQYACVVKEMEVVPKKDDPTKRNLKMTYALSDPAPLDDDPTKTVNAGYIFTEYYPLQQSDNPNAPDFKVGIAKLVDAVFHTDANTRPSIFPAPSEFIGRPVVAVVKVDNDPQYGKRNSVAALIALR